MKRRMGLMIVGFVAGFLLMVGFVQFMTETAVSAEDSPVVIRAYFDDRQQVWDLASWREPWHVDYETGFVVLDVRGSEIAELERRGFRVEVDEEAMSVLTSSRHRNQSSDITIGIPGYSCYRTVEETYATAEALATTHPDLVSWIDIGDSWEKTAGLGGYDLMVLKLTNNKVPEPKPVLFAMSSMHAREYAPAELLTRFAEQLVAGYNTNADINWLLDFHEVHLLLHANPDGRKQAETGISWRKNTNQNYCSPTSIYRGADLNRNFEFGWGLYGGSSGIACDEVYRGPSAASEPETQAVQNYVRSIVSDQRDDDLTAAAPMTTTGVFLDIHSYSELVLWPWGGTDTPAPNGIALQTLGRKLAYFNDYTPEQAVNLYPTDGTTGDFAYGELGLAAYTFELGNQFFQDCATFEAQIVPDNLDALLYAAKVSGTPYQTPSGPDVLSLEASMLSRDIWNVTAVVDDTRYRVGYGEPTQPISTVLVSVSPPPWSFIDHQWVVVGEAKDYQFDEAVEEVTAVIDTLDLAPGRRNIYMQAQDTNGNWGSVSSIFIDVRVSSLTPWAYLPVVLKE